MRGDRGRVKPRGKRQGQGKRGHKGQVWRRWDHMEWVRRGFGETEDVPRQRQRREISSPHPNRAFYRHLSPVTWTTPTPHSPGSDEVLGQGDGDRGTSDGHVPLASTFRLVPDLDMCP